jgi:membrane associated rhomboid family serine protease
MSDEAPPKPPTPAARLAAFHDQLRAFTPRLWLTYAIIAVNVGLWIAGVATGVSAISPSIDSLIAWGADYGPRTVSGGEWWRLASNTFLHIGVLHLAMNMIVLVSIGRFVERLVGQAGFAVLYLVCGVAGSLVSLAHNPYVVSAGASGAVFGLYGALLGFLLRARGTIPREVLAQLQKSAFLFLFYNLVYGLGQSGIDLAAHLGGLAAGFLGGLLLGHPLDASALAGRARRTLTLAAAGVLVLGGATFALPRPPDWDREAKRFTEIEHRTVTLVQQTIDKNHAGKVSDRELGHLLAEVVPEWRAERDRFASMRGLPDRIVKLRDRLVEYIDARADAWTLFSKGLQENDTAAMEQGRKKLELSDELVNKISAAPAP